MPFPFTLPTTSSVLLSDFLTSSSHPSLPLTATTKRSIVKDALKKHKRLSPRDRPVHLSIVQDALLAYIPYLLALASGAGCLDVGGERVEVDVVKPLVVEWRSTISATLPGREPPRPRVTGLHHEIAFVLSSLAYTYVLQARSELRALHGLSSPSAEQRTAAIGTAMKQLLQAHSVHRYLLAVPSISAARDALVDVQASTISALASLELAEATLIVVSKDDPYAAAVADDRNENNTDWMFKSPEMPPVRARLFAGICLAAAEHAGTAHALLARSAGVKADEDLVKFANDLRRTARAKAIRFLAINSELSAKTGEALAYIAGARSELGLPPLASADSGRKGFKGLKHAWQEKREDRKVASASSTDWGLDAGRLEETRVIEMLHAKWDRENNTINVQVVPDYEPLLRQLPSAREYHTPHVWTPPTLDETTLWKMRAPIQPEDRAFKGDEDDSGEDDGYAAARSEPVGAFPGSAIEYGRSATSADYY
ncbi:hypothetical protein B0A48_10774 [Cryoendolithus antarcticus]|uniref:pH-response regulator protein palC n=1 Tax=Cryoendolithus antarcticus TaxID=1507870 RepID=A0A1V8SYL1_9PEZI|nr:hypothetical protein B0A48_10774 [Cryoendolithus antarcticus]